MGGGCRDAVHAASGLWLAGLRPNRSRSLIGRALTLVDDGGGGALVGCRAEGTVDDMDVTPEAPGLRTKIRLTRRLPGRELSPAAQAWLKENQGAIDEFNRWDAEHGSPLDEYRDKLPEESDIS